MVSHAVRLRIQPLAKRPPVPVQVKNAAQQFRDMLAAGYHQIIKAVVDSEGENGRVVGIADWIFISEKRARASEGVTPAPPRERTQADALAEESVDLELRQQVGETSSALRNKTMGDSEYWYLSLLFVDPGYQYRGIGQVLLQWGLDHADKHSPPLEVYLESSDDGLRLYEKNGFEMVGWNSLPDENSDGGNLRWPALKRRAFS
ncbi:hypothetical protein FB451DRAFT_1022800 [Mycena latifolia]|nr:hypothetical protein FB451DRAFT_1022800 [Mycena latifolia]